MQTAGRDYQHRNGWMAFSVDGSMIDAPRTQANEDAFGINGRTNGPPQMQLTVVRHLGTGLPWDWTIGSSDESERTHVRSMLQTLPESSLLVMDAGFTGYDLLREIESSGRSFLVRVAGNVTLLHHDDFDLERCDKHTVWLWPKNRQRTDQPLKLRLIRVTKKNGEMYLVTNVFDTHRLSRRRSLHFYRLRWGDEVFFRGFKKTLDRRIMCSKAPRQARMELEWSMIGMTLLGLLNIEALITRGIDPLQASVAKSLRAVRAWMRGVGRRRNRTSPGSLQRALLNAIKDTRGTTISKRARHYPHKKYDPPPRPPRFRPLTQAEYQQIKLADWSDL